jgi:hypothetical protein
MVSGFPGMVHPSALETQTDSFLVAAPDEDLLFTVAFDSGSRGITIAWSPHVATHGRTSPAIADGPD